MIRYKNIILPFLLTAWAIIFAHSIIPHHHHVSDVQSECHQCHNHFEKIISYDDCDHDCTDHACHFHVDILTKFSIDNVFIKKSDNNYSNYPVKSNSGNIIFYKAFFSEQIPKTNYLRGPPMVA